MIKVLCDTQQTLLLSNIVKFQGDLKKRTPGDVQELAQSLVQEGLIMPFVIWQNQDGINMLLDGHGRLEALTLLSSFDNGITTQEFPVLYVKADTEEEARKCLLQITSAYGKITKKGAQQFCSNIPTYRAPSINKLIHKPLVKKPVSMNKIIRISVPVEKSAAVIDLLKQVDYIQVL